MTVKIPCPNCRGYNWAQATAENWDTLVKESKPHTKSCTYCSSTGVVSLLKHYYTIGKHKEIKRLKKFISILEIFNRNKIQNQNF